MLPAELRREAEAPLTVGAVGDVGADVLAASSRMAVIYTGFSRATELDANQQTCVEGTQGLPTNTHSGVTEKRLAVSNDAALGGATPV